MAGGKLSARQKMINLMYLVFIAMLALQMSKKVLSAFGESGEEMADAAKMKAISNQQLIADLQLKAKEQPEKYAKKNQIASEIENKSSDFINYMKNLKSEILKQEKSAYDDKGVLDYEKLDKSSTIDNMFFKDGKISKKGKEFQQKIEDYRNFLLNIKVDGKDLPSEQKERINKRFNTADVKHGKKGNRIEKWLEANFEGFPVVASLFKLDNYVNKSRETENEILSGMIGGQLKADVSVTNYEPVVVLEKSAYFPGERVKGKIALGRVDSTMSFKDVIIAGRKVPKNLLTNGYVK